MHPAVIEWDGGSGTSEAFPMDTYVVLTREKIEATLGGRPWAMLRVDRTDRFDGWERHYALYLLVERLP